jgi:hypothetical protein
LEIETPKANVIPDFCRMFVMLVIGDLLDEEMEVESSLEQLGLEVRPFNKFSFGQSIKRNRRLGSGPAGQGREMEKVVKYID